MYAKKGLENAKKTLKSNEPFVVGTVDKEHIKESDMELVVGHVNRRRWDSLWFFPPQFVLASRSNWKTSSCIIWVRSKWKNSKATATSVRPNFRSRYRRFGWIVITKCRASFSTRKSTVKAMPSEFFSFYENYALILVGRILKHYSEEYALFIR